MCGCMICERKEKKFLFLTVVNKSRTDKYSHRGKKNKSTTPVQSTSIEQLLYNLKEKIPLAACGYHH